MKFILVPFLFVCLILCNSQLSAQSQSVDEQRYIQMMQQPHANFFEIQKEFNEYWKTHTRQKGDGWKPFKRWEHFWESRVLPDGSFPDGSEIIKALEQRKAASALQKQKKGNRVQTPLANFTLIGPSTSIPTNGGSGRLCTIAFNPTNTNNFWVGSPAGGLWKTTNNGASWTSNTDQFTTLGVSAIAFDPTDPNIMYIGTGDRDASDTYGTGILKSTDGGTSWNATAFAYSVQNFVIVSRIIVHPSQPNIVIAASSNGIYKSTNGGANWSQKYSSSTKDMVMVPSNPNYLYATSGGTIVRSTNAGETWTALSPGFSSSAVNRIALAVCAQNPRCVYALCSNNSNSTFYGIYRSLDTGNTWSLRASTPNILGGAADGSDTRGQGWYDLCIAVNQGDSNDVFVGGINTWRSTNGGTNWTSKSMWYTGTSLPYVHADEHEMMYKPGSTELYVCNDGGLFRTTNFGTSWNDLSAGLQVMQLYRISQSSSNANKVIGGAQDNGTNFFNAGGWAQIYGGDGMDCAIDQANDNVLYASSQTGNFGRSTNNGASFSTITPSGLGGTGAWVTPIVLDSSNYVYLAYKSVYRSTNQGTNWTNIGSNVLSSNANYLHVARSNPQYIVVGNSSLLYRTTNGGANWTSIKGTLPSSISRIAIHPSGPDTMIAVMSNWTSGSKVYKTTDGGSTWTNISGSLPNIPVNCAIYENNALSGVYIGTDIGIYYRNNSLGDWVSFDDGLPNVRVYDLEIYYPGLKLRAGTYGRGAWQGNLYTDGPHAAMSASKTTVCVGDTVTLFDVSTNSPTSRSWLLPGASPSSSTQQNPVVSYSTPGLYSVTLMVSNSFGYDTATSVNYINVLPTPSAAFNVSQSSACFGDSIVLSAVGGMRSYRWSTGDTTQSIALKAIGSYQISVQVTNLSGCSSTSAVQSYTIYTSPTTTMTGDSSVCAGSDGTYRISTSTPGSLYRWFKPRSVQFTGDSTTSQVTYKWTQVGRDTVHFRETNIRGCTVDRYLTININAVPTVGISGNVDVCQNSLVVYSTTSIAPGSTIVWQNPKQGTIVGSNTNTGGVNIMWSGVGNDSVVAVITSSAGCTNTGSLAVAVKAAPAPSPGGPLTACVGAECVYSTPSVANASYKWVIPQNAAFVGDSSQASVRVKWTQPGTDSIRILETAANGCSRESALAVSVGGAPLPSISGADAACINHNSTYTVAQNAGSTYAWRHPRLGTVVGDTSHNTLTVAWTSSGSDTLVLVEQNAAGCTNTARYTVQVGKQLNPQLASADGKSSICPGEKIKLSASTGYSNYTWYRNGAVLGESTPSIVVSEAGAYYVAVDNGICSGNSDTVRLTVYPATPVPTVTRAVNTVHCDIDGVRYQWYHDNVLIDGATNQNYTVPVSGNYCVKIVDVNGCQSESGCLSVVVSVEELSAYSNELSLAPNPAEDVVSLQLISEAPHHVDVRLIDATGREFFKSSYSTVASNTSHAIPLIGLSAGVYYVEVQLDRMQCRVLKLIHF